MPQRIARYLRRNAIALLALFVALGGTSYAAITISGGQLRNHSVDAVKLNPRSISGSVKAWVELQWEHGNQFVVIGSSSPVRLTADDQTESITWTRQRFAQSCVANATPQVNANDGTFGYVNVEFNHPRPPRPRNNLALFYFRLDGTHRPQAASVIVVCP